MFLATHGILARGGGVVPSLLLDTYPNAAVAYSLRQLRTAYTGAAIRVRRSSDNAEQDINFVGGDLDTQSLLDFVGYNLWTYSEDLSNGVYTKTNLNITADTIVAPDTLTTADKFYENTNSGGHQLVRSSGTILNSTDYNVSCYLKQGERTKVLIQSSISGIAESCDLDLTNGTISNSTFTNTPIVTNVGNDWYRFSVTITSGLTSTTNGLRINLYNASNQTNYLGDGTSGAYAWGFQLTQSSSVKPYEKTTTDAARNAFITTWYDQSGNANDANQPTLLASQCQIVSSGSLILDADTSKISTTWSTDRYNLTNGISTNTQYLSVSMWRRGATTTDAMIHLGNSTGNAPCPLWWTGTASAYSVRSYMSTLLSYENVPTVGRCIVTSLRNSANLKVSYRNGVQLTNTATQAPVAGTLTTFGQVSTNTFTSGQYQEYIYWDSEQSANRTAIEDNIKTYWNAY